MIRHKGEYFIKHCPPEVQEQLFDLMLSTLEVYATMHTKQKAKKLWFQDRGEHARKCIELVHQLRWDNLPEDVKQERLELIAWIDEQIGLIEEIER